MPSLTIQFSGVIGTLTFVSQITAGTPLESAMYRGLATAAAIFLVMLLGDLAIRAVMKAQSSQTAQSKPSLRGHDSEDSPDALAA